MTGTGMKSVASRCCSTTREHGVRQQLVVVSYTVAAVLVRTVGMVPALVLVFRERV
jgi:hypothetical protein